MALVVPDVGEIQSLTELVAAWGGDLVVDLYQNDYTPVAASVVGSFTVATFSGYAQEALAGGAVNPAVDGDSRAFATWDEVEFTHNGGGTSNSVYGYYVRDGGGNLLWAERFDAAPIAMANSGDQLRFVPKLTLKSEN